MCRQLSLFLGVGWLLAGALPVSASVIGYWRFDGDGGTVGQVIDATRSEVNGLDARRYTGPGRDQVTYFNSSLPGPAILDPLTGTTYSNSMAARLVGISRRPTFLYVPKNDALNPTSPDGSFTFEFFVRIVEEPLWYDTFARRTTFGKITRDPNDRSIVTASELNGWGIDISHGSNSLGQVRSRWDTPGSGIPRTNWDWSNVSHGGLIYVDTDTGSGDPRDYTRRTGDIADEGDGINDLVEWHHVALVWNGSAKEFTIFADYQAGQTKRLVGDFVQPDTFLAIAIGRGFEYYIDEIRYTSGALSSNQFLRAVPEPSSYLTMAGLFGVALLVARRRKRSCQ